MIALLDTPDNAAEREEPPAAGHDDPTLAEVAMACLSPDSLPDWEVER